MVTKVNNFTVIESVYGRCVVNRHCQFHAGSLIKSGCERHQGAVQELGYEFYPVDQLNLLCAPLERLNGSPLSIVPE